MHKGASWRLAQEGVNHRRTHTKQSPPGAEPSQRSLGPGRSPRIREAALERAHCADMLITRALRWPAARHREQPADRARGAGLCAVRGLMLPARG